jgi:hypothetical protein
VGGAATTADDATEKAEDHDIDLISVQAADEFDRYP